MSFFIQAVLAGTSGMAEDNIVNTFSVQGGSISDSAQVLAAIDAVEDFYTELTAGFNQHTGEWIGTQVSRSAGACQVRLYDLNDLDPETPMGSPFEVSTFTMGAAVGASNLPGEVAFCMTLESAVREFQPVESPDGIDPGSAVDRPRQRHTGRHYIGPLRNHVVTADGAGIPRPATNFTDHLVNVYTRLYDELQAAGMALAIWSRQDQALRPVEFVSFDNAFDTMRSRGRGPTVRTRTELGA